MRRWAIRVCALLACCLLFPSLLSAGGAERREYDLVVVGAGTGGCAAAIQAAQSGLSVALVEESDRVGGQIVGAAVSTMDDVGRTRHGIYAAFIERVRAHYAAAGAATNICLWGGDTIATEPRVAEEILKDMLARAGRVDLYMRAAVAAVRTEGNRLAEADIRIGDAGEARDLTLRAKVFIDATEHGDFLAGAGARYRVGNSLSPRIAPEANVQDITYVTVVRRYPGGLPDALRLPGPPPQYEAYVDKFRSVVTVDGDTWPGKYPFDIPSHNAYRAVPDPEGEMAADIVGDDAATWRFITKTCVNWANDHPGNPGDVPGLSVRYIEDPAYRKQVERAAMHKTLCFLWYMQSELGMTDWSVDDTQGYGGWFSNDWQGADDPLLSPEFAPVLRLFPPFPYVREGRRIVGVEVLAEADIKRDPARGRTYRNDPSSLALGEYPVDIHGSHLDRYMEHDLGETDESFPKTWVGSQGVFQVPMGVFIPESLDGLIAAEKNISVSRMVNGAIRLHPVTMHTGQAAGAIAAEAVRSGRQPRDVALPQVQLALMDAGCWIALERGVDVPYDSPYRTGVQWASLHELLPGISKRQFGATLPLRTDELRRILAKGFPDLGIDPGMLGDGRYVSRGDFAQAVYAATQADPAFVARRLDLSDPGLSLERGEALTLLFDLAYRGARPE